MLVLILGLLIFLGMHSVRIFADDWRTATLAHLGEKPWKGAYSLVSLVGFALIVWGYGLARAQPLGLWAPPSWARHLAALLMLFSLVLLVAANVPKNGIKARLHHPQVLAVKTWAFGHLLAAGMLHDAVLFGAFLLWSVLLFTASRRRDRREGTTYPPGTTKGTVITIVVGVAAWAAFAFWLHALLIGVKPVM